MTKISRFAYDAAFNRYPSQPIGPIGTQQNPHSRQTSINSTSRFSFASTVQSTKQESSDNTKSDHFLPPVSFDDLHSRISGDQQEVNAFPAPGIGRRVLTGHIDARQEDDYVLVKDSPRKGTPASTLSRQGSLRRQNSTADRGNQVHGHTDDMGPPSAPLSNKSRRQSYFPTSTNNISIHRSPRKSVGPGTLPTSFSEQAMRRRTQTHVPPGLDDSNGPSVYSNREMDRDLKNGRLNSRTEDVRVGRSGKNSHPKSLLPPPKLVQDDVPTPFGTPDQTVSPLIGAARSPVRSIGPSSGTPSSDKRLSMVPNCVHATGLAARTISPTDARRMKRLSMMPTVPPIPFTPPTPHPDTPRSVSRNAAPSPSMMPRKSITPSSSRTTPDPNRKSYSSGISNSSSTSYNSMVNLTPAARLSQSFSTSRLPTLKTRIDSSSVGNEEEVPPVPAIPKAYESPKTEIEQPFFSARKSSLPLENGSATSGSTADGTPPSHLDTAFARNETGRQRRGLTVDECPNTERRPNATTAANRRTLQPLRLPPLNLLPLSTPTAVKIAALYDGAGSMNLGTVTPPPKLPQSAIPSTPMTASKASFSRTFREEDPMPMIPHIRSNSSHYSRRPDSSGSRPDKTSYPKGPTTTDRAHANPNRKAISPFMSSSLPKTSGDFGYLRLDTTVQPNTGDLRQPRLPGPQLQGLAKDLRDAAASQELLSSTEANGSSLSTSIRRKLSLTRNRSGSKSQSRIDSHGEAENLPAPPKRDNMPPPKLPASATWHGPLMPSPSPTKKPRTLESRRKASASSITNEPQQMRNMTWATPSNPKPELAFAGTAAVPSSKRTARAVLEGNTNGNSLSLKDFLNEARELQLDPDDLSAEDEMRRLAARRKDTEAAAKEYDALRRRATAKDRVGPSQALRVANLNIFERGEIVDYKDVYFCGTQDAKKHVGDLSAEATNFGYDDERGDYTIITGDHLAYRYEMVDVLGKGSFGQVARCIDHKTGGLVAVKIIRNKKRFHQQALVEVDILQKLRDWVSVKSKR